LPSSKAGWLTAQCVLRGCKLADSGYFASVGKSNASTHTREADDAVRRAESFEVDEL
jgi:hypothetical protein